MRRPALNTARASAEALRSFAVFGRGVGDTGARLCRFVAALAPLCLAPPVAAAGGSDDWLTTLRRSRPPDAARPARTLRVVYSSDPTVLGRCFDLARGTQTFGRVVEGPGSINDLLMSREHARVVVKSDGSVLAEDLRSSNGTYVDGARITAPVPLGPQAVLSMGETLLVLDEEPPAHSLPAAPDATTSALPELIGTSLFSQRLRRSLSTVAPVEGAVLLLGPTGSGKEIAARAVHRLSGRSGAFVPVNAAAIPGELAEGELFGHRRGAFTGAASERAGYFAAADKGTLFLDEIGDLAPAVQAKLLRVLEDGRVTPLGGTSSIEVDVRVVAATSVDIERSGFRSDLLARTGDWTLRILGLSQRRSDILPLFEHFYGGASGLSAELAEALLLHDWPMNVRELAKLAKRLKTLHRGGELSDLSMLPPELTSRIRGRDEAEPVPSEEGPPPPPPPDREAFVAALTETRGNMTQLAAKHGWHRTQVYRWARKFGLDPTSFRGG